jgi:hypothetical protein
MQARLHLQFRMFEAAGELPCESLDEACAFFRDYAEDTQRCKREGVTAVWVTRGGVTVLGEPPEGWAFARPLFSHYENLRLAERMSRRLAGSERRPTAPPLAPAE